MRFAPFTLGLVLLVVCAFMAVAQGPADKNLRLDVKADGPSVVHVIATNEDGEVVLEDVTSPLFGFKVEEGHLDSAGILECQQITEIRTQGDVSYPVVMLKCGNVKMILVGVDLTRKR